MCHRTASAVTDWLIFEIYNNVYDFEYSFFAQLGGSVIDCIRLYEQSSAGVAFLGGEGTERLELNDIDPENDGDRGWFLSESQSMITVHEQGDANYAIVDGYIVAEFCSVEELRFLGEVDSEDDVTVNISNIAAGEFSDTGIEVAVAEGDNFVRGFNANDTLNGGLGNDKNRR